MASGALLGVPPERVAVVDRPDLQDGLAARWDAGAVAALVREFARRHAVDVVVTFDDRGVSGHPNHVAVWRGVAAVAAGGGEAAAEAGGGAGAGSALPAYALETVPVYRKFLGILDVPISVAVHAAATGGGGGGGGGRRAGAGAGAAAAPAAGGWPARVLVVGGAASAATAHRAMQAHASQYVWFRRLFVVFSRYTVVNSFTRMGAAAT